MEGSSDKSQPPQKETDDFTNACVDEVVKSDNTRNNQPTEKKVELISRQLSKSRQTQVILASQFDGIASARLALEEMKFQVVLFLAWETDPDCTKVTSVRWPDVQNRGDFLKDDPAVVATLIAATLKQYPGATLLWTGGPPCWDYSRIKGDLAKGRFGSEGQKFERSIEFLHQVEHELGRPFKVLYENVVAKDEDDANYFDVKLQCQLAGQPPTATHVVVDAADHGVISRPRMWWFRLPQNLVRTPTGKKITVSRYRGLVRWHDPDATKHVRAIQTGHLQFPVGVSNGKQLMPCLLTPAPKEEGRPPPRGALDGISKAAQQRWKADHQQYAPWTYETHNMMMNKAGELELPTPEIKEQMHQLPVGYTDAPAVSKKARHRMLGNGWHIGVAKFLLYIVLQTTTTSGIPQLAEMDPNIRRPSVREEINEQLWWNLHPCGARPIEWAARRFLATRTSWGPGPKHLQNCATIATDDPQVHLQWSLQATFPGNKLPPVDPSLAYCLEMYEQIGQEVVQWRKLVCEDLKALVEDMHDETMRWVEQLPQHVHEVYVDQNTGQPQVQMPTLIHILRLLEYPDVDVIQKELTLGFPMLGRMTKGAGWHKREDDHYSSPKPVEEFMRENDEYIQQFVATRSPDDMWSTLLVEIETEVMMGRIEGPFEAPQHWKVKTVATQNRRLIPLPQQRIAVAPAFPITQTGSDGKLKIRRGEDWRRSGHNQTIIVEDAPHHSNVDAIIQLGLHVNNIDRTRFPNTWKDQLELATINNDNHEERQIPGTLPDGCQPNQPPVLWGHDHEGAYRQLALDDPDVAFMVLMTPTGPTLWRHRVLLFGASSAVWAYNRFGDILVHLNQTIAAVPSTHYVDDYVGVELPSTADSAFSTFQQFNSELGMKMKPSKAQAPAHCHKMLGVQIQFQTDMVVASPTSERIGKLRQFIKAAMENNELTQSQAATLAGKLAFVHTTLFGRVGRAATKPIYGRQHSRTFNTKLTHALTAALRTTLFIITKAPPRTIKYAKEHVNWKALCHPGSAIIGSDRSKVDQIVPVVYADAFFQQGDEKKTTRAALLEARNVTSDDPLQNGWGAVIFPNREGWPEALTIRGAVPRRTLLKFTENLAYIYFQIVAAITAADLLGSRYVTFCDNEAAKHALIRGYGRDPAVNAAIGTYWCFLTATATEAWLDRVSSEANLSDEISRDKHELAQSRGWAHVELDYTEAYSIMEEAATNMQFAHEVAPRKLYECLATQFRQEVHKMGLTLTKLHRL